MTVIEVRRVNDSDVSCHSIWTKLRELCGHMLHKWKIDRRKKNYEDLSREWTTHHMSELTIRKGDLDGHVGGNIGGFQVCHGGCSIGKINQEGRMLLEFCEAKQL